MKEESKAKDKVLDRFLTILQTSSHGSNKRLAMAGEDSILGPRLNALQLNDGPAEE
jgi:hypothetical protein